jgi:integrase/recombinase XerD
MTPLRQQMIDAMRQRGFSERTQKSYLGAVNGLAQYFHQSPNRLQAEQIQDYFVYLVQERGLCGASCRLYLNGIRFLFLRVLHWPQFDIPIQYPKKEQRIPELLTRLEVGQITRACHNDKHRMMLLTCYACGLRVSELVSLMVRHIDGERLQLRIDQGKGKKDRMVVTPPTLLDQLRLYWRRYRPSPWLFPNGNTPTEHLSTSTIQRVFTRSKNAVGIKKIGGIHGLRHAYATHQLEQGISIQRLQQQLGHSDLRTTLRYLHWLPNIQQGQGCFSDLLAPLAEDDRDG